MSALASVDGSLWDEDHRAFRESAETFLARRVVPEYAGWRAAGRIPRDLLTQAAQDGFLGIRISEAHGGPGVEDPRFGAVVVQQAMLAGAPAVALALGLANDVAIPALMRAGVVTALPQVADGSLLVTVAEGDVTIADGTVTGTVPYVVSGVDADLFVVVGSSPQAVLVRREGPGVTVTPSDPGIGLAAAGLADVTFDGAAGEPLGDATPVLSDLALALAVSAVAGARAALHIATDYVLDRKAFGQPIAQFENTRQMLGDAAANLQAGEAFLETGIRAAVDGTLSAPRAAALKLHCTELYGAVVDTGVQLHGGYGYIMEYPIAHAYSDARFWRLFGGTSETMRDRVAGAFLG